MMSALLVLASLAAAHAGCDAPVAVAPLANAVSGSELAFGQLDESGFRRSFGEARGLVACLGEPVSPALAARLHRLAMLSAFMDGDEAGAAVEAAAARRIDPALTLDFVAIPPEHPMRKIWGRLSPTACGPSPLPRLGIDAWLWDGTPVTSYPPCLPGILQDAAPDGRVGTTWWLAAGDTLPRPSDAAVRQRHPSRGLVWGAAGALAASAASYALELQAHRDFMDDPGSPADLEGLAARNNAFFLTSTGFAVVSGGLVVTAVFVGRW